MSVPYTQTPPFRFGGIDQRGDDLSRPPSVADDSLNICPLSSGDEKSSRQGFQFVSDNSGNNGGFGAFSYNNPSGEQEILVAGSTLYRKSTETIAVSYSGSGASVVLSLLPFSETETFVFTIVVDGVEELSFDLGVGYDESSIVTAEDLKNAIDGLTDFSATISGGSSSPAAFIPQIWQRPFVSGSCSIEFVVLEEVNHPTGAPAPFAGSLANRNSPSFENISSLERGGVIYFANGYDEMKKYDGTDCYRAGVPKGGLVSVTPVTSGSVGSGSWPDDYSHAVAVVQKDAQGNEVIGEISETVTAQISELSNFTVVINNVVASSGFNTDCAIVAGSGQTSVSTIIVDDGSGGNHTMKVGQTAYFYDAVSNGYVEREITAVDATSITVAGPAVTVADNAVISNNLRLRLFRTEADGQILYEVADIPNNSFASTQSYLDNTVDSALGGVYDEAELRGTPHGIPPKFKYLATFKGLVVGVGSVDKPTFGYFSDIDSPEYWPPRNEFRVENDSNQPITGAIENGSFLWVFKKGSIRQVVGDLSTGQFEIIKVSDRIGCEAHATIKSYDNLICWLGDRTFFASENGAPPIEIGRALHRFFRTSGRESFRQPSLKRAIGAIDEINSRALFFLPFESVNSNEVYANSNSRVVVYDFVRGEWHLWDAINAAGGIAIVDEDMFWVERRFSTFDTTMSYSLAKRHNLNNQFDYVDHNVAISAFYRAGWVHGEAPSVNKDFLKYKLFSNNSIVSADFSVEISAELNFIPDVAHSRATLDFEGGTGLWGIGPWGGFSWGSPAGNAIRLFNFKSGKSARALRPTLRFSSFFNQVVLTAWQLEVAPSHEFKMKF